MTRKNFSCGFKTIVFKHFPSLTLVPDFQLVNMKATIIFAQKSSNESNLFLASHFTRDPDAHIIYIILTLGKRHCVRDQSVNAIIYLILYLQVH